MQDNVLKHYGVKGQKWGVRREIKRRSIAGARIGNAASMYSKRRIRLENKISKAKTKGASIGKLANLSEKKTKAKNVERALLSVQKKLYKGISKKDIAQGERAVKRMDIAGILVGGHLYNLGSTISTTSAVRKYASK